MKFTQSKWLEPYITLNTDLRKKATSAFAKDNYKLSNNAVYGTTMENLSKRVQIKLLNKWENRGKRRGANYWIAKPNFHSCQVFNENLIAVQMKHTKIFYHKPIFVGFSILDISKTLMHDFYYNFIKSKFPGELSKLCYMNTDSLTSHIQSNNVYEAIRNNINLFDTSNYNSNNEFNIPLINKAVPGLFKDEYRGRIMSEFVGLRSKMYAHIVDKNSIYQKAKGLSKISLKNHITFAHYKNCLFNHTNKYCKQHKIRSFNHNLYTIEQNRLSLSYEDGVSTLAWGHYQIT